MNVPKIIRENRKKVLVGQGQLRSTMQSSHSYYMSSNLNLLEVTRFEVKVKKSATTLNIMLLAS